MLVPVMNIFCLGSCRAIAPFEYLDRIGSLNFANKNLCWYSHNVREVIQRLKFLENKKNIPVESRHLTMDIDSCTTDFNTIEEPTSIPDIGVFEISTRVIKTYNGVTIHSTCASKQKLTDYQEEIQTFEELEQDIVSLFQSFRKIFVICNIDLDETLENTNIHRKMLNDYLTSLEEKHKNIHILNPNILIGNSSEPKSLLEDNNHFDVKFIPALADYYIGKISSTIDR
tara:strand:+ start:3296 stop:3979 length:684 start_codon:yes stop_codon:yes gene_type:complete